MKVELQTSKANYSQRQGLKSSKLNYQSNVIENSVNNISDFPKAYFITSKGVSFKGFDGEEKETPFDKIEKLIDQMITNNDAMKNSYDYEKNEKLKKRNIEIEKDIQKIVNPENKKYNIEDENPDFDRLKNDSSQMIKDYIWARTWDKDARKFQIDNDAQIKINNLDLSDDNWFNRVQRRQILENAKAKFDEEAADVRVALKNADRTRAYVNGGLEERKRIIDEAGIKTITGQMRAFQEKDTSLDKQIAGYEVQKGEIRQKLIKPLLIDKTSAEEVDVPKAVLIYGPIGTGKTTFARAIAAETDCYLAESSADPEKFAEETRKLVRDARKRYLTENGKRTIILVNEVDKYLRKNDVNFESIAAMKTWLDVCSKRPNENQQEASGVTFIFTTNHPMLITDEIRNRRGKRGVVIPLGPPVKNEIKDVFNFYIDKSATGYDWLVNNEKKDKDERLSEEEIIKLNQKPPIVPAKINVEKIAEKLRPDIENGAFSCDLIRDMVVEAYHNYINDDKNTSFAVCLAKEVLNNTSEGKEPDIESGRLKEFEEANKFFLKPIRDELHEIQEILEFEVEQDPDIIAELEDRLKELQEMQSIEEESDGGNNEN